jgi:chromatin remodeling complex protein RSC6
MSSAATPAKRAPAKKTAAAAAAPVVAAPAPAPVKVVVAAPAPAPVAAPAVAAAPAEEVNVVKDFNSLVEKVNSLRTVLGAVLSDMKKLEKQIPRELKKASKGRRRRAATVTEGGEPVVKKESVFTKPTPISDALCTFLGVAKGSLLSRSEVTTKVCAYAKSHNLMEKQLIKTDKEGGAPLRKLLALTEKDELKILNLQRYLKPHYLKAAVAPVKA